MSTGAMPFDKDMTAVTPSLPTPAMRARSLGQMGLGSRGSGQAVRLTPAQRMMASNVDVQTAAANMMANATNPEFRDFARKYASPAVSNSGVNLNNARCSGRHRSKTASA